MEEEEEEEETTKMGRRRRRQKEGVDAGPTPGQHCRTFHIFSFSFFFFYLFIFMNNMREGREGGREGVM